MHFNLQLPFGQSTWIYSTALMSVFTLYVIHLFASSRRRVKAPRSTPEGLFFVFMVPCLNEELVVADCIDRLLSLPGDRYAILVVDDGSDDRTAEITRGYDRERVWLLQRTAPDARIGKGPALNGAYRHLASLDVLKERDPADVIIVVVDADGRIEMDALFEVGPLFTDQKVAAVQIGVRMYNAKAGLLARMQDFEFVTFTEIFQRARTHLGIAGLGGNGQFNRLSALHSLGEDPWSECLTEDLDLGIRLIANGWRTAYCSTTWVNQQAVTDVRRLLRQRSRWFQGHLQCWKRLGLILKSPLPTRVSADLVHHLLSPALVLLMSVTTVLFLLSTLVTVVIAPMTLLHVATYNYGLLTLLLYILSFGITLPYAYAYWLQDPSTSCVKALIFGHCFTLYNYLWFLAGWLAVFRFFRRRRGWAKTTRTAIAPVAS